MTSFLIGAAFACVLLEFLIAATWDPRLFRRGIVLKRFVIPRAGHVPQPKDLESFTNRQWWGTLRFHAFTARSIGFRQSAVVSLLTVPYVPMMRGEIQINSETGDVTVIGRASLMAAASMFGVLGLVAMSPDFIPNIALFALLLIASLALEAHRFGHVADAISMAVASKL